MTDDHWDQYTKLVKKLKHRSIPKISSDLDIKVSNYSKDIAADIFNLKIPSSPPPLQKKRQLESPVDVIIDLHGMTQEQAYMELSGFLKRACKDNKRHALIVTGKGPLDNPGVIKLAVPRWLEHTKLKGYITSYSTAKNSLGGAISVILKRKN